LNNCWKTAVVEGLNNCWKTAVVEGVAVAEVGTAAAAPETAELAASVTVAAAA
jgi:hypothetical protein